MCGRMNLERVEEAEAGRPASEQAPASQGAERSVQCSGFSVHDSGTIITLREWRRQRRLLVSALINLVSALINLCSPRINE